MRTCLFVFGILAAAIFVAAAPACAHPPAAGNTAGIGSNLGSVIIVNRPPMFPGGAAPPRHGGNLGRGPAPERKR